MWDWSIFGVTGIVLGLFSFVTLSYALFNPFQHWKKKGMPYLEPRFPIIGSLDMLLMAFNELARKWYDAFPNEKFFGTFVLWRPCLVIKDPELIERVLIKDFSHFYNRDMTMDPHASMISNHIANQTDERWKMIRSKLVPSFSSAKTKGMQPQLVSCSEALVDYFSKAQTKEFDMKDFCGRFALDVISTCAYGTNIDIINNPSHTFRKVSLSMFNNDYLTKFFWTHTRFIRPIYETLGLDVIPKKLAQFFVDAVDQTLEHRAKNNIIKKDFLQLLNELKLRDEELLKTKKISQNDPAFFDHHALVSNAFIFLGAGYESTSGALSFMFYEMALNPHVQEKLYEEIVRVTKKHNGEFSYEAVTEMTYLDQVFDETLRKHSPLPYLDRVASKDYIIPGTDTVISAGTKVIIPIYRMHHEPEYFPQPDKFIPERFDPERNAIIKGTYLPFGGGPHMCLAMRFARNEIKTCAAKVLNVFKILPSATTKAVLEYDSKTLNLSTKDPIVLRLEKRAALKAQEE